MINEHAFLILSNDRNSLSALSLFLKLAVQSKQVGVLARWPVIHFLSPSTSRGDILQWPLISTNNTMFNMQHIVKSYHRNKH